MSDLDIIDQHLAIRETVGYEVLNEVPIEDMPTVLNFLKIAYNYNRMKRAAKEESSDKLWWFDEQGQIDLLLSNRSYAEGFYNGDHDKPQYLYNGTYYVLNSELTKILKVYA